jgi:hypothetical protein
MATQAEAADHIFLSERRFRELVDEGVITRRPKDRYDLHTVRREAFKHLRKRAAGTGGEGLAVARTSLAKEQTAAISFKTALARSKYVLIASAVRIFTAELLTIRENFLGLPSKEADALAEGDPIRRAHIEEHLRAAVYEILENLSNGTEIVRRATETT